MFQAPGVRDQAEDVGMPGSKPLVDCEGVGV